MSRILTTIASLLVFGSAHAQAATLLFGSDSCTNSEVGNCITLSARSTAVQTVATVRVNFPASGYAITRWSGSMQCTNFSSGTGNNFGVADFSAVVTRSSTDAVNYAGRNGFRASMRIPPFGSTNFSVPVTVDASLHDNVPAGTNAFYLRVRVLRMDSSVFCTLLTGSFTGTFNTQ